MFIVQFVIFNLILFVGLALLLRQLMGRHATTATAHLQQLSQDYLRKQDELKKRLEDAERQYQEHGTKSQEEAQQLRAQAVKDAEASKQQILTEAKQEAEHLMQQAVQARETIRQELEAAVDAKAIERACALLHQVLPQLLRAATHAAWLDELLARNGLLADGAVPPREPLKDASVVSAFPLTDAQRQRLLERLRKTFGPSVSMTESVDPALVAGLIITAGHVVVDGSLSSKLREATRDAKHAVELGA